MRHFRSKSNTGTVEAKEGLAPFPISGAIEGESGKREALVANHRRTWRWLVKASNCRGGRTATILEFVTLSPPTVPRRRISQIKKKPIFSTRHQSQFTLRAAAEGSSGSRWKDFVGALRLSVNRRRMSDAWMKIGSRSRESLESWLIWDSVSPRS